MNTKDNTANVMHARNMGRDVAQGVASFAVTLMITRYAGEHGEVLGLKPETPEMRAFVSAFVSELINQVRG